MSFGITYPCWNCKYKEECKDAFHIQEGIDMAHQDTQNHKGCGQVVVMCSNCVSMTKYYNTAK